MPKWLHKKLAKTARKKKLKGEAFERYVYGGMQNWKKKRKAKKGGLAKP